MKIAQVSNNYTQSRTQNTAKNLPSFQARFNFNKLDQLKFDYYKNELAEGVKTDLLKYNFKFLFAKASLKLLSLLNSEYKPVYDSIASAAYMNNNSKLYKKNLLNSKDDYDVVKAKQTFMEGLNKFFGGIDPSNYQNRISQKLYTECKQKYEAMKPVRKVMNAFMLLSKKEVDALKDAATIEEVGKIRLKFDRAKNDMQNILGADEPILQQAFKRVGSKFEDNSNLLKERFPNVNIEEGEKISVDDIVEQVRKM